MACHAKYLQDRPSAHVRLEGSTDERGTREYNLGLGERRGNAVAAALEANGASADQITVVSYGEERPVCREHNEACWSKNRRVNIDYTAK
jgi:peptidoglycan-associated lipoprotein